MHTHQFGSVLCVAYSPDGRWIATGTDGRSIRLFDAQSGETSATMLGHDDVVAALAFSPDCRTLVSGGTGGEVKVWDVFTGQFALSLEGLEGSVSALAFSPDGTRLAACGETPHGQGEIHLWYAPHTAE